MKIRSFLTVFLFLFLFSAVWAEENGVGTNKQFKGPVGLQLYSLRDIFSQDVPKGMQLSEDFGFKYVELAGTYGLSNQEMNDLLAKHHLIAVAGHWGFDQFEKNPEIVAKEAKELGLKFAGVAWIPHEGDFDEAEARHAADVFNKAGAVLAKEGITFYYHNHGYEFQPFEDGTLFDLLIQQTDPKLVSFQMDVLWTIFPGQDPVAILKKYPNRFSLFHLKDLKKGVEGNLTGGTSVENDVPLGSGQVDYPALLKTAQEVGVQYYFIEDESPTVLDQIPVSLKYLESVEF